MESRPARAEKSGFRQREFAGFRGENPPNPAIRDYFNCPSNPEKPPASAFFTGDENQLALAERIRSAALAYDGPSLVDGHLIVSGNKVPVEAITALAPKAILMVTGAPKEIAARRASDASMERPALSEQDIAHAQSAELEWAQALSQLTGVPLMVVDGREPGPILSTLGHAIEGR